MLPVYFAPLQGYTDFVYRAAHHTLAGGVGEYYTPFIRWEHGGVRNKDLRDVAPQNNQGVPTVPQVIAKNRDELCRLCDLLQETGWRRIDLNMGCPFPMQVHAGRGSGLLVHEDLVAEILEEMGRRKEVSFSVKMRLGQTSPEEGVRLIPLINDAPLESLTLHPRLGTDQYRGSAGREAFQAFYEMCRVPMIFNGDITAPEEIEQLETAFPRLKGVMVGRGLLARPTLAKEYAEGATLDNTQRLDIALQMHQRILEHATNTLQGDTQILNRMRAFWEYQGEILSKKTYKHLMKCGTMRTYREALAATRYLS